MLLVLCRGSCCSTEALWLLLTAGALLRVRFLMLEFLTCLRIKFCNSRLPPSRVPRPTSIHCRHCTFIEEWLWFTFTLPWLFGPIKLKSPLSSTHPSLSLLSPPSPIPPPTTLCLCPQVEGLKIVSHCFHTTRPPSINNPLRSLSYSRERFVLSLLQSYSSGHFSVKEVITRNFIVFMLWFNYYEMTLSYCWNKGNLVKNIDLVHQNEITVL